MGCVYGKLLSSGVGDDLVMWDAHGDIFKILKKMAW